MSDESSLSDSRTPYAHCARSKVSVKASRVCGSFHKNRIAHLNWAQSTDVDASLTTSERYIPGERWVNGERQPNVPRFSVNAITADKPTPHLNHIVAHRTAPRQADAYCSPINRPQRALPLNAPQMFINQGERQQSIDRSRIRKDSISRRNSCEFCDRSGKIVPATRLKQTT